MKVVFDTNVLVAALISHGTCSELVRHCAKNHELFLSEYILKELEKVLTAKFKYPPPSAKEAVELYHSRSGLVIPVPVKKAECKDKADLPVLGTALAARCDCLITGDKDLLLLGRIRDIRILQPGEFWNFEDEKKRSSSVNISSSRG